MTQSVRQLEWPRIVRRLIPVHRRPPVRPAFRRLVDRALLEQLRTVQEPTVAVISGRPQDRTSRWISAVRPRAAIHRIPDTSDRDELHLRLAAVGKCDLIIDETDVPGRVARMRDTLFHLRVGGVLLLRRRPRRTAGASLDRLVDAERRQANELFGDVFGAGGEISASLPLGALDRAIFGRSVRSVTCEDGHLMLVNGQRAQAKIREESIQRLLELRPGLGEVIDVRAGVQRSASGTIRQSCSEHQPHVPTEWTAPDLVLRRYNDVVSSPGQVVSTESLILPDSYRKSYQKRLRSSYICELSPLFADLGQPSRCAQPLTPGEARRLPGAYYHLDSEARGHFGHVMTEVVARFWGWPQAKAMIPDLRVLLHANKGRELAVWEIDLLTAAGIAPEDIVFTHDAVRVDQLITATQMFRNPVYVHPGITDVWSRIGDRLEARAALEGPNRIFIGRRLKGRACRNAPAVEQLFTDHGFTVIYPEDYSLPDQVRMFRGARAIAGFAGSGMFNIMFAARTTPVVIIASETYTGRNEVLMTQILGQDLSIAWCRSEASGAEKRDPVAAYHAPFVFDFEREGRFLREVIAGLPG